MIALHKVASALETWQTNYGRICCELYAPPKCRAFIAICCNMRFIQAAQFLYAQYPGIYKMRIKHKGRTRRSVMIRVYSGTGLQRTKACKGYSLASAVANLMQCIKKDRDLLGRLTHPERFVS